MARKRVALAMLSHRSNAFCPVVTPLQAFRSRRLAFGPEVVQRYAGTRTVLGGLLAEAERQEWDLLPIIAAAAPAGGVCEAGAYDYFRRITVLGVAAGCSSAEGLDAAVLVLSGSMVVEGVPDPAADLAVAVRGILGRRRPLVLTCDFLSNLSRRLIGAADACLTGQTHPPSDLAELGAAAVDRLARLLQTGERPVQHLVQVPLLASPAALCTAQSPMADLLDLCRSWESRPGMVRIGVSGGFPYADVPHAGLSVLAVADGEPELARLAATEVAELAFASRRDFRYRQPLIQPSEVFPGLLAGLADDPRPVALIDPADDPGCGAAGDAVHLLRALTAAEPRAALAAALWDPDSVAQAARAGVGAQLAFDLGGRLDPDGGPPLHIGGRVRSMGDGRYQAERPDQRGLPQDAGRSALLELGRRGGVSLVVTEGRVETVDPGLLRHLGVDPSALPVLLLKGGPPFHPDAWGRCIELDGPGVAHPDLGRLPFRGVRRPVYPLDPL